MNRSNLIAALENANVQAFLHAIRLGEGTSADIGYKTIVGGSSFNDFSHHPNVRIFIRRYGVWSTAAGAYQIINKTWLALVREYGFENFSPDNQDQAAVALIIEKHALEDILSGDPATAAKKCNAVWASLPGSASGQRTVHLPFFIAEYQKYGGAIG